MQQKITESLKRPKWPYVISLILLVIALIFAFFPFLFVWKEATNKNTEKITATVKYCEDLTNDMVYIKTQEYQYKFAIKGLTEEQRLKLNGLVDGEVIVMSVFKTDFKNFNEESDLMIYITSVDVGEYQIYTMENYNSVINKDKVQMVIITSCGSGVLALCSVGLFLFYMLRKKRIKIVEV